MGVSEEHSLPTESPDIALLFRIDGLVHKALERMFERIKVTMASLQDEGRGPQDYEPSLQEIIDKIDQIARDHESPAIHIRNSPRPRKSDSWQTKVIIILATSGVLGAVATYATVASLKTKIEDYILSNDKRMDRDESQTWDIQRRLDRGAAIQ